MKKLKKSIKVNELEVIDTSFIYSRVIALQLTKEALQVENVSSFEIFLVLTTMFDDTVDMKSAKFKSSLSSIGKKVSFFVNEEAWTCGKWWLHHIVCSKLANKWADMWLYCQLLWLWLYVFIMSCMRFRVNPHSVVAWMSRNSLLETGAKSEI